MPCSPTPPPSSTIASPSAAKSPPSLVSRCVGATSPSLYVTVSLSLCVPVSLCLCASLCPCASVCLYATVPLCGFVSVRWSAERRLHADTEPTCRRSQPPASLPSLFLSPHPPLSHAWDTRPSAGRQSGCAGSSTHTRTHTQSESARETERARERERSSGWARQQLNTPIHSHARTHTDLQSGRADSKGPPHLAAGNLAGDVRQVTLPAAPMRSSGAGGRAERRKRGGMYNVRLES